MNFVIDLAHRGVSVVQWKSIGVRNPGYEWTKLGAKRLDTKRPCVRNDSIPFNRVKC